MRLVNYINYIPFVLLSHHCTAGFYNALFKCILLCSFLDSCSKTIAILVHVFTIKSDSKKSKGINIFNWLLTFLTYINSFYPNTSIPLVLHSLHCISDFNNALFKCTCILLCSYLDCSSKNNYDTNACFTIKSDSKKSKGLIYFQLITDIFDIT